MENLKRNRHVQINVTNNLHVSCDADLNKETGKVQPYIILEGAPDEEASNKDIVKYRMFINLDQAEKIVKVIEYLKSEEGTHEIIFKGEINK
jgi:hypothetical protein